MRRGRSSTRSTPCCGRSGRSCPRSAGSRRRARTAVRYFTRLDPFHVAKIDRIAFRRAIKAARARTRFDVAQVELSGLARCVAEFDGLPSVLVDHEAGVASGGDLSSDARAMRYMQSDLSPVHPRRRDLQRGRGGPAGGAPGHRRRRAAAGGHGAAGGLGPREPACVRGAEDGALLRQPRSPAEPGRARVARDRHLAADRPRGSPDARCVVTGRSRRRRNCSSSSPRPASRTRDSCPTSRPSSPARPSSSPRCARAAASGSRTSTRSRPAGPSSRRASGRAASTCEDGRARDGRGRDAGFFATPSSRSLHDPALAARLGTAGRDHVARTFTHEAAASSNLDLWKRLAPGSLRDREPPDSLPVRRGLVVLRRLRRLHHAPSGPRPQGLPPEVPRGHDRRRPWAGASSGSAWRSLSTSPSTSRCPESSRAAPASRSSCRGPIRPSSRRISPRSS